MTRRKSVVSKMLLLLIVLTLVSCCYLGGTFARYTSKGEGAATITVAKWDIQDSKNGSINVSFDKLSPAVGEYNNSTPRQNSTGKIEVATLKNGGDVGALVTVTFGGETIKLNDGIVSYGDDSTAAQPSEEKVKEVFEIKLWYGTTAGVENATNEVTIEEGGSAWTQELAAGDIICIYAEVIWTSDVGSYTEEQADLRDTWIGQNVKSVGCTISYTAVQNTQNPEA